MDLTIEFEDASCKHACRQGPRGEIRARATWQAREIRGHTWGT